MIESPKRALKHANIRLCDLLRCTPRADVIAQCKSLYRKDAKGLGEAFDLLVTMARRADRTHRPTPHHGISNKKTQGLVGPVGLVNNCDPASQYCSCAVIQARRGNHLPEAHVRWSARVVFSAAASPQAWSYVHACAICSLFRVYCA